MISTFPIGHNAIKVVGDFPGTWELGVAFHYGRGRSFNTYTRYFIRRYDTGHQPDLWSGWPSGAPDPMDPSERRRVYDWIEHGSTRTRRWVEKTLRRLAENN